MTGNLTRVSGENAGFYTINASALTNGNYVITALNGVLIINSPVVATVPVNPTIVPAFSDNGSAVLATSVSPSTPSGLNYVPVSGRQDLADPGTLPAGANSTAPVATVQNALSASTLNFVQASGLQDLPANTGAQGNVNSNAGERLSTAATGNGLAEERSQITGRGIDQLAAGVSTLNFVSNDYVEVDGANNNIARGNANNLTSGEGTKRNSSSELNINNITVPSSTGPVKRVCR